MDLYSKKIIGHAYGTSMTAELAVKAVENACLNVKTTEGIMRISLVLKGLYIPLVEKVIRVIMLALNLSIQY